MEIFERLFASAGLDELASVGSLEAWRAGRAERWERWERPIDVAIEGGLVADRVGLAFVAGYDAALHALWPELSRDQIGALCATEETGAHPRAIQTRLTQDERGRWRVAGDKRWVTGGELAETLLVVATTGTDADGRPRLRVAAVRGDAAGVERRASPAAPFVPEIPHAAITLRDAAVETLLPGDGYSELLKPFRTVEDLHVHAALLAYQLNVARRYGGSRELCEALAAALAACRGLTDADPRAPSTHIALAGLLSGALRLRGELDLCWAKADPAERERWQRDLGLFAVAGKARAARRERAWEGC